MNDVFMGVKKDVLRSLTWQMTFNSNGNIRAIICRCILPNRIVLAYRYIETHYHGDSVYYTFQDELHGPASHRHSGNIGTCVNYYVNGITHGPQFGFHKNGRMAIVGQHNRGRRHGTYTFYADDGGVKRIEIYFNGVRADAFRVYEI